MKGFTRGQIRAQIRGADSRGPIRAVTACWSSNYSLVIDQNCRWQRVPLIQRKPLLSGLSAALVFASLAVLALATER